MSDALKNLEEHLPEAIRRFWSIREQQAGKQGGGDVVAKDRGERGAVTGGKQMDGFVRLIHDLLVESGLSRATIFCRARSDPVKTRRTRPRGEIAETQTKLPGWFRSEKDWDLLVVVDKCLIAAIEFKSQIGPSFGNNFNNRTEEALGSAIDLWAAYREGAFRPSQRPWLGYLLLLEEAKGSMSKVRISEPHFSVFTEFRDASYAARYEIFLTKLVRERLYDAACFLMSTKEGGLRGEYREPNLELSFKPFLTSLLARAIAVARSQAPGPKTPPVIQDEADK